jgi:hypothetical protein
MWQARRSERASAAAARQAQADVAASVANLKSIADAANVLMASHASLQQSVQGIGNSHISLAEAARVTAVATTAHAGAAGMSVVESRQQTLAQSQMAKELARSNELTARMLEEDSARAEIERKRLTQLHVTPYLNELDGGVKLVFRIDCTSSDGTAIKGVYLQRAKGQRILPSYCTLRTEIHGERLVKLPSGMHLGDRLLVHFKPAYPPTHAEHTDEYADVEKFVVETTLGDCEERSVAPEWAEPLRVLASGRGKLKWTRGSLEVIRNDAS